MTATAFSEHAQTRLQQRAIPPFVVNLLMEFGSAHRCGGTERLTFDKQAMKRLRHHFGGQRGLKVVEPWLKVYAVIGDDGTVVTTAHKRARFRR